MAALCACRLLTAEAERAVAEQGEGEGGMAAEQGGGFLGSEAGRLAKLNGGQP